MSIHQNEEHADSAFKRCSYCGKEWMSREDFLEDQSVVLNGYQWNRHHVQLQSGTGGLLLFTHHHERCGTTMALSASKFRTDDNNFKKRKYRKHRDISQKALNKTTGEFIYST